MNSELMVSNLLNPPVLFFFLGMIAVWLKSDLDVPQPLPKFFSLYLLLSLGFKGGVELHKSGVDAQVAQSLLAAIAMALVVPLYAFWLLRRRLDAPNAAAIAATYGSVSAVTFITATAFLSQMNIAYGGHMVAAMALMESPAIIVGVLLARRFATPKTSTQSTSQSTLEASSAPSTPSGKASQSTLDGGWPQLLREAFFNGSVFVLVGSLIIGLLTGEGGEKALKPFTGDIFKGVLCLFLLDMGLVSARRLGVLKKLGAFPIGFALLMPLFNAFVALVLAHALNFGRGDALLFCVLCASASYIAVPAAMRLALPEANPGVYVPLALAITFPFNVAIGIPLYMALINGFWR